MSFIVDYASNPWLNDHYFGYSDSYDGNKKFRFDHVFFHYTTSDNQEREDRILNPFRSTSQELMTNASFKGENRSPLLKPVFLFGDHVSMPENDLEDGDYKWFRKVEGRYLFLPNMERSYPFLFFQSFSVPRQIDWHINTPQDGILFGGFNAQGAFPRGTGKSFRGLLPGLLNRDLPRGEIPLIAQTFLYHFTNVQGEFSVQDFHLPGWVHCSSK